MMRGALAGAAVVGLLAVAGSSTAQTSTASRISDPSRQAVVKALQDVDRAANQCDDASVRRLTTTSFVGTFAYGDFVSGQPPAGGGMPNCVPKAGDTFENLHVTRYGDAALVEGIMRASREDGDSSAPRRFTALFVQQNGASGGWQAAAVHMTPIDVSPSSRSFARFFEHRVTTATAAVATSGSTEDVTRAETEPLDVQKAVLDADSQINRAITDGDAEAWSRFIRDDLSMVWMDGIAGDRASRLNGLKTPMPGFEARDQTAAVYGNVAVTTAFTKSDRYPPLRYTRFWLKDSGGWKVLASQVTRASARPER